MSKPWAKRGSKAVPMAERFWEKVDKRGPDECWNWLGGIVPSGYGSFKVIGKRSGPKNDATHRVAYVLTHGKIPKGLWVLHSCDNRRCVNPKHLWLGTNADNSRDCTLKGRQYRGITASKLSNADAAKIRKLCADRRVPDIAKQFNVHECTIYRVISGQTFARPEAGF